MCTCNVIVVEVPDGIPTKIEHVKHAFVRSVADPDGTQRRTSLARKWLSKWAKTTRRKRRRREAASAGLGHPDQIRMQKYRTHP